MLNSLPSASVERTPYEHWNGSKPKYSHLRVFGSYAYVHVPNQKRLKLDPKAVRMVFVGYAENRKAYRFLDTATNRIVTSWDATFLETEMKPQESVRSFEEPKDAVTVLSLEGEQADAELVIQEEPADVVAPVAGGSGVLQIQEVLSTRRRN